MAGSDNPVADTDIHPGDLVNSTSGMNQAVGIHIDWTAKNPYEIIKKV